MKTNIDISLIKTQKYEKNIKNEEIKNEEIKNEDITKKTGKKRIKIYNFFSINESKICNKISKIPNYFNYYNVVIKNNFIKVGEMNERVLEQLNIINTKNNDKYLLFEYNSNKNIDFEDFLYNLPNPKLFLFHAVDSYNHLLNSLITLKSNNICFFNLSSINIVFGEDLKPLLENFEKSLLINNIADETYFLSVVREINDFTYKPIEIHLLFYIIANNEDTLSYSLIEIICENYIENMSILSFFSENDRISYKNQCVDFLKKYINRPKKVIINDIILNYDKWDNYSLSVLYLHIFGNIIRAFSLKETFINKILLYLIKNINPDPLKRDTLEKTLVYYNELFDNVSNWTFINSISQDKMNLLYEYL
jgi:hypothetical protein